MNNTYTKTSRTTYGKRIKNSFGGAIFGALLIVGAIALLGFNERRSLHTSQFIRLVKSEAVSLSPDDSLQEEGLSIVHAERKLLSDQTLSDPRFNVSTDEALQLKTEVEMYQWEEEERTETKDNLGGSQDRTTTYSYSKVWSSREIDSTRFQQPTKYSNPSMGIESLSIKIVDEAIFGDVGISRAALSDVSFYEEGSLDALGYVESQETKTFKRTLGSDVLYSGIDQTDPQIGDRRVSFSIVSEGTYSLVGKVSPSGSFDVIQHKSVSKILSAKGSARLETMIADEKQKNTLITWGLRLLGWFLIFIGMRLMVGALTIFFAVIPMLKKVAEMLSGVVLAVSSFLISFLVISIAWMAYRPLYLIAAIGLIIGAVVLFVKRKRVNS